MFPMNEMSAAECNAFIARKIDEDFDRFINSQKGHAFQMHAEMSDGELISRMIHVVDADNTSFASCFFNLDDARENMQSALWYAAQRGTISKWLQSQKKDFDSERAYQRLIIRCPEMDTDNIGRGFDSEFREVETRGIVIVLQRDFSGESELGFYPVTAYPDLSAPGHEYTGLQYTKQQVAELPDIAFDSVYKETAFRFDGLFDGVYDIKNGQDRNGQEYLRLRFWIKPNEESIAVYINHENVAFKLERKGEKTMRIDEKDAPKKIREITGVIKHELQMSLIIKDKIALNDIKSMNDRQALSVSCSQQQPKPEQPEQTKNDIAR